MYKLLILLAVISMGYSAEISSSYSLLDKHEPFTPELKTEPVDSHKVQKESNNEEQYPVFRGEGRAKIELVKSDRPVVKHDMLADQPSQDTQVNRVDKLTLPNYGFVPAPAEIAYPDVAYAPGYGYDGNYVAANNYDGYGNSYTLEPDTSAVAFLWNQMPDSRAVVGFVGRTIAWVINSFFVIILGSFITVGLCSYTELCTIRFHGVGPIHEEMRALITPERLEKISTAADFVKNAIDKYQKIQKVSEPRNPKY